MFCSFSTIPAEKRSSMPSASSKAPAKKPPMTTVPKNSVETTAEYSISSYIVVSTLLLIWVVLMSFAGISIIEPEWLKAISKPGIDSEAQSMKEYADALLYRHEYERAIGLYQEALRIKPGFTDATVNTAVALTRLKQEKAAEQMLLDTLKKEQDQVGCIHFNLGLIYENLGEKPKAIESYRSALNTEMDQYLVYSKIGQVYLQMDDLDNAHHALKDAEKEILDVTADYRYMLKHASTTYKDDPENLAIINQLLASNPTESDLQRYDLALIDWLHRKDPELGKVYYFLGTIYAKRGQTDAAREYYEKCLAILPRHEQAKKELSSLLKQKN